MQTNFVKAFISAAMFRMPAEFMCLPRVIDRPMPKKMTPNLARFIRATMSLIVSRDRPISATRASSTGWSFISARIVVQSSKSLPGLMMSAMSAALAEGVSRMSMVIIVRPLRPSRDELALLGDGVLAEMPRMALRRVPAPVDDEVRPVLDFAQRARDLATQLGGYLSGAVSKRGVAVDHASDHFGQGHGAAAWPRTSRC